MAPVLVINESAEADPQCHHPSTTPDAGLQPLCQIITPVVSNFSVPIISFSVMLQAYMLVSGWFLMQTLRSTTRLPTSTPPHIATADNELF